MALPTTITGASTGGLIAAHMPPMKSSEGAYYCVAIEGSSGLRVYKASDPTDSFSPQTAPTRNFPINAVGAWQDGDLIHIVVFEETAAEYFYYVYDMFDDAWDVDHESIEAPKDIENVQNTTADIIVRGSGDPVIVAYYGDEDSDMGTKYSRIDLARRSTGGSWTVGIQAFHTSDAVHWRGSTLCPGSKNGVHVFCINLNTDAYCGTTFRSDNTFFGSASASSSTHITTSTTDSAIIFINRAVSFNDGGTYRVRMPINRGSDDFVLVWRMNENGTTGDLEDVDEVVINESGNPENSGQTYSLGFMVDGTILYALWGKDGTADLYVDSAPTPQGSGDWGTDADTGLNMAPFPVGGASVYTRNGAKKIGLFSGTVYDEIDIDPTIDQLSDCKFPLQSSYIGPYEI